MPIRFCAATFLIGVCATADIALAQAQGFVCAPLQPSTSSAPAYRSVPGQARCEGFFERSVSQPFIELVSLTRGAPPAAGATPEPALEIHADVRAPLRLLVQPQRSSPFYRVDAAMQGGQALSWDPAPMLAATRLALPDLGFLAVAGSAVVSGGALPAIAPVAFSAQARTDMRVFAVVRVSVEVSSMAWRGYRTGADALPGTAAPAWADLPDSHRYAWQRITLPIELPGDGKGLRVDVQAVGAKDALALPLLRFTVLGPRDGSP